MEIGKLLLENDVQMSGPGYVASTAGTGAVGLDRIRHRVQNGRVLAHPKIIVRTPYRDVPVATVKPVQGFRKSSAAPFQICENAVIALLLEAFELRSEKIVESCAHARWFQALPIRILAQQQFPRLR